jgi:GntR family transcriptional regulator/MocR family aminotransferase
MKAAPAEIAIAIRPRGAANPTYRQLYTALRAAILEGRLRPGVKLPSTRDFARRYTLARGTVVTAFEQLKAEGYLAGRVGSGTYVSEVLPDGLLEAGPVARTGQSQQSRQSRDETRPRKLSDVARRAQAFAPSTVAAARAFRANQPALDLFPTTLWAQVAARRLRRASAALLKGCPPLGHPPLQRALADYLGASRGVTCEPEQIAVVSGAQEAIDLVIRLVLNTGDRVCMEDPGYVGAARAFAAFGASLSRVALDSEGMRVPDARDQEARLAYVTPAHQFPMGMTMSLPRRLALLDWAHRSGAMILEDDYDSEFRFTGRPVPALQGLDRHGCVLFAGSFSKVLFPSLRLGYLVVPSDLVDRLQAIKSLASRQAPVMDQAVLCDFIVEGHFGRHIRRMRQVYAERLAVLLRTARDHLGALVEISPVEAGLQTSLTFRRDIDGVAVTDEAARCGIEVIPLSRYASRPLRRDGLLLGFAAVDAPEIRRGMRGLAPILKHARRRTVSRT